MKNIYTIILLSIAISLGACTQKAAQVVHKRNSTYNPNYSEVYVESPDGKMARSLRGHNNADEAQKINIINKKNIDETIEYKVKSGDNLSSIANSYNISMAELANINNIKSPYKLKVGQKLIINTDDNVKITKSDIYTVQSGDNLSSIANKIEMPFEDLVKLNDLKSPYALKVGQKLKILISSNNKTKEEKSEQIKYYIVKSGDNLSSIANKNNTKKEELALLNNLKSPYTLKVGQKLKINEKVVVISKSSENNNKSDSQVASISAKNNKKNDFIWPIKGDIISNFGNKSNGLYNDGINISATKGSAFKAAENGVVAYVGNELRGYGTIILIKHDNNWISAYAHCNSVNVSRGDMVEKGQTIGTVGQTGSVESPQLYFSLRSGRKAVNPLQYLN